MEDKETEDQEYEQLRTKLLQLMAATSDSSQQTVQRIIKKAGLEKYSPYIIAYDGARKVVDGEEYDDLWIVDLEDHEDDLRITLDFKEKEVTIE